MSTVPPPWGKDKKSNTCRILIVFVSWFYLHLVVPIHCVSYTVSGCPYLCLSPVLSVLLSIPPILPWGLTLSVFPIQRITLSFHYGSYPQNTCRRDNPNRSYFRPWVLRGRTCTLCRGRLSSVLGECNYLFVSSLPFWLSLFILCLYIHSTILLPDCQALFQLFFTLFIPLFSWISSPCRHYSRQC